MSAEVSTFAQHSQIFLDFWSPQESGPEKAELAGMTSHSLYLSTDGLLSLSQEAIDSLADDTTRIHGSFIYGEEKWPVVWRGRSRILTFYSSSVLASCEVFAKTLFTVLDLPSIRYKNGNHMIF